MKQEYSHRRMKKEIVNRFFTVLSFLAICLLDAKSLTAANESISCVQKLIKIGLERGEYKTDRGLRHYRDELGNAALNEIAGLTSDQTWVDVGAGEGVAADTYLERGGGAKVVTIDLQPTQGLQSSLRRYDNYSHLTGNIEKFDPKVLPRADVITDLFGPMAYSPWISAVLWQYVNMLKPNGQAWIRVGSHLRRRERSSYVKTAGTEINIIEWMKRIPGLIVDEPAKGVIHIRKEANPDVIRFPELKVFQVEDDIPPGRWFLETDHFYEWINPEGKTHREQEMRETKNLELLIEMKSRAEANVFFRSFLGSDKMLTAESLAANAEGIQKNWEKHFAEKVWPGIKREIEEGPFKALPREVPKEIAVYASKDPKTFTEADRTLLTNWVLAPSFPR